MTFTFNFILKIIEPGRFIAEPELVRLLNEKDKHAFEYLYDHYSAAVYGVVLRIVNSAEIAEEISQDCFLRYWNKINEYDSSKGKLFTWMINIARNLAIDKIRSKDFKQGVKTGEISGHVSIPDNAYGEKHKPEHIGVREMLNVLSAEQKELLDLMYFRGYTQSEISEEFGIPLGTIKTRVRAAVNKLRGMF
jgi:RNA polymerase sigma factor (sigma-70 family)